MNLLNRFTIRNLRLNKKRTLVTIIGIILSTALICAVAGVACSFQQTLVVHAIENDGDYHASFFNVPEDEQKYIKQNRNVESYFLTKDIGYAKIDSQNEYKPYLHLMGFDSKALNSYGIKLIEGRLPENDNEIIISNYIEENGGVNLKVGDKITLDICRRLVDGEELSQINPYNEEVPESLEKLYTKEYEIVGKMERPNYEIEDYSAPGYTIITCTQDFSGKANISVKFTDINKSYDFVKEMNENEEYETHINKELLRWSGVLRNNDTLVMLYSLAGIVIAIIIVSSVFVIRNSFQISITEKLRQYGMLASIGATKKQIRKNVLFEGFILGIIGIPLGILSGCFATFVLIKLTTYILLKADLLEGMEKIVFDMPLVAILLSIALGAITIFLSSISSARKASKISPIEAIRSNNDIKIKAKKLKTPKLISKFFGIGGEIAYKNLKRNKSKYRTTVISLVVSITIFISLSTFIQYMFDMSGIYYETLDYNVYVYNGDDEELAQIEKLDNVEKISINRDLSFNIDIKDFVTEEGIKYYNNLGADLEHMLSYVNVTAIGDEVYKEYIEKLGLSEEDTKNGIIYIGDGKVNDYKDDGTIEKIQVYNFKEGDELKGKFEDDTEETTLKILKVTNEQPFGFSRVYSSQGVFLINFDLVKDKTYYNSGTVINSNNPDQLCEDIKNISKDLECINYKAEQEQMNQMVLLISIFLYGFITVISLIGVTNIFNTITTNMNLRSKEFANLKSIGMTKKEFNRMINLESFFYGTKSLIYGIIFGTGISYFIYHIISENESMDMPYIFPKTATLLAIIFVMIIVGIIMRYSLSKINKQNIIETIRNDNI